ncbi:MAG: hypothetical protein U5J97_01195 [Trueperaceae bacterium]|nr:hypothetical protein [Trueperaceae bacterium]
MTVPSTPEATAPTPEPSTPEPSTPTPSAGDRWRQSLVLVTILATIAMNALANILPLMGRATGDISDAYPVPFTPSGYVFSIWGVIYLGLIVFGIWQARPGQAHDPRLRAAAPWIVLSGAFNVAWLVAWHAERVVLSTLPIVGLLVSLIVIYETLGRGPAGLGMRFGARLPFSLYLGWLTVATVANVAVAGWALGWRGAPFGAEVWALVMIAVASLIGLRMLQVRRDVAFALVLVWAFVGIAVSAGVPSLLAGGALLFAALVLGGAVGRVVRAGGDAR